MGIRVSGTSVLLTFEGENTSTTFVDESPFAFQIVEYGSAYIDTENSICGKPSARFDGNSYLHINTGDIVNKNNFTLEFYAKKSTHIVGSGTYQCVEFLNPMFGPEWAFYLRGSSNTFSVYNSYNGALMISSFDVKVDVWYHYAFVKTGTTIKLYIDGVLSNTTTTSYDLNIGNVRIGNGFTGNIGQVRLVIGHALYSGDYFSKPTESLQIVKETVAEVNTLNSTNPQYLRNKQDFPFPWRDPVYFDVSNNVSEYDLALTRELACGFSKSQDHLLNDIYRIKGDRPTELFYNYVGYGSITGNVKEKLQLNNVPCKCRVYLYVHPDNVLVRCTWSDAQGNYVFYGVNPNHKYMVIARHPLGLFNVVAIDNITPAPIPQPSYKGIYDL